MNEKERLQLENELLMTCSKSQAINKYIDELEESSKLSELWCKSQQENKQLKHILDEKEKLIDTILTFNLFGEECPLNFGFEKDSLQEKAQSIFYEDDGEYCENNCNECYKKCWLRFFNKIKELRGRENVK